MPSLRANKINKGGSEMRVCDSCMDSAYEEGVSEDDPQGDLVMLEVGDIFGDHFCDQRETDGAIKCRCACNS